MRRLSSKIIRTKSVQASCIKIFSKKIFVVCLLFSPLAAFPQIQDYVRVQSAPAGTKSLFSYTGNFNQIAIFVELADTKFDFSIDEMTDQFNGKTETSLSFDNYFKQVSCGKVHFKTYFPMENGEIFIVKLPWTYIQLTPYDPVKNPEGDPWSDCYYNYPKIIKAAIEAVIDKLPANVNFDIDNDGIIDFIAFYLAFKPIDDLTTWSNMKVDLSTENIPKIDGKAVHGVAINVGSSRLAPDGNLTSWPFDLGVMCHETIHIWEIPDYYHYNSLSSQFLSVGRWDIMCRSWDPPQYPSAYLRGKLDWIDIPEIKTDGRYTLYPANSGRTNNVAYKIYTNADPNRKEYVVVEYRHKGDENLFEPLWWEGQWGSLNRHCFDGAIHGTGLVIYRVNENFSGNSNAPGLSEATLIANSELMAYQPGGTHLLYGNLDKSYFSANVGRTAFTPNTDPYPFLAKGTKIEDIYITNISLAGETISFDFSRAPILVSSIELNKSSIVAMLGEADQTLVPTILPENAFDKSVTWITSDDKVAKISSDGVLSFVGAGSCTITVKTNDGDKTATCSVTVEEPPVFPIIAIADEYPVGTIAVPLKVHGVGADKLTVCKVNGVQATELMPTTAGVYEIEASSADGKIKITTYVIVK